jgi:hypothetical protein
LINCKELFDELARMRQLERARKEKEAKEKK